jgi:hypothetical protein
MLDLEIINEKKVKELSLPYEGKLGLNNEAKYLIEVGWWEHWCDYTNFG